MESQQSDGELFLLGAAQMARGIATGRFSSIDVVSACIERIKQQNGLLGAVVVELFEESLMAATRADDQQASGDVLGPLHGVPVTIKECFHVAGTPSTMGLSTLAQTKLSEDGLLVARLRAAGAIVLGKTNVPQLMLSHETVNPVYGQSNNPWDVNRTPGGSSGGEAAIIAAGGSPLGLGSDMGGSIRVPAHFCGICGIKPTSRRLTKTGTVSSVRGMEAIQFQPGPLARRVEDLELALRVLIGESRDKNPGDRNSATYDRWDSNVAGPDLLSSSDVDIGKLRVGVWTDDQHFPPSPAVRRAVDEAAAALRKAGTETVQFTPPNVADILPIYLSLASSDGGNDARRLLKGSEIDRSLRKTLAAMRMPRVVRPAVGWLLRLMGWPQSAEVLQLLGPISADSYWRLNVRLKEFAQACGDELRRQQIDVILCPPYGTIAPPHGVAPEMIPAASYTFLANLLELPAGVVPVTSVRPDEQTIDRPGTDPVLRCARQTESNSTGMPVGVQVIGPCWREDMVLAVMQQLENHFRQGEKLPFEG